MRGVSNVISALFVVTVILVAAYSATEAYITYAGKIAKATKDAIKRTLYTKGIEYSDATCDDVNGTLSFRHIGTNPEYLVRVVCYDAQDPLSTWCVVPYEYNNIKSAQYIGPEFPPSIDLNIGACSGLTTACMKDTLRCKVIGMYLAQNITVRRA